ncbi:Ca-activated chloride channel family protein [Dendrosporobacter quercicolus]|uniref:Ca-activated chloride channel family protein n=1 Tax=Dendrosporobacter quercicolus TaxID=146817 RepID=A0A1G9KIA2_9FIRM|nr:vWA domain-containing protein [Dendrosporobacter quercicolus]SDL49274.1 Ca-activated chloride channel family protein [Dendrosporobacter quercicolus]
MGFKKNPAFFFFWLFALFISFWSAFHSVTAAEAVKKHEIVFLLDVSYSMNTTDAEKLAPDCLEEILYTLPSNYMVGLVTYGSDVQAVKPVDAGREQVSAALRQVNYSGYTNAGAGLERALGLFQDSTADKTVILLSDGEIMLDNPAATQVSGEQFNRAMQAAAQRGIRVLPVVIGDPGNVPQANIYTVANRQGMVFQVDDAAQLSGVAKKILYEVFGIAKIAVSSGDLQTDTLNVRLPLAHSDSINEAKILLTSTGPLGNIGAGYTAHSGEVLNGKRFAAVLLRRPQSEAVEIRFGAVGDRYIQANLILDMMTASVQAEVKYTGPGQPGKKLAEVRLIPVSTANPGLQLLQDPYFEGKPVQVTADGQEIAAMVEKGAVRFLLPADSARSVAVKVRYEDLGINLIAPDKTYVEITQPAGYGKMLAVIAALVMAIAALVWWRRRTPEPAAPPPPASCYEYAGKLKIYVTKTPDDSDVAPMEYNLYRHFRKEEISLGAILENCGLPFFLAGAYKILFSPGANKALVLTNKSDCTVLKNRDLLVKDHSCLVYLHERIHITFEDERSELILEYKNVKPSERH